MKAVPIAVLLLGFAGFSIAQAPELGPVPPGIGQDGSGAAGGALKGGSIQPGERSGMPERDIARCKELVGTLREQCLKDVDSASGGSTSPGALPKPDPNVRDPSVAPPPQNPR